MTGPWATSLDQLDRALGGTPAKLPEQDVVVPLLDAFEVRVPEVPSTGGDPVWQAFAETAPLRALQGPARATAALLAKLRLGPKMVRSDWGRSSAWGTITAYNGVHDELDATAPYGAEHLRWLLDRGKPSVPVDVRIGSPRLVGRMMRVASRVEPLPPDVLVDARALATRLDVPGLRDMAAFVLRALAAHERRHG